MTRNLTLVLALLAGVSAMQAATIEYQGAGGNLAVAGNWYIITDAGNPASRTGVTRLPAPYGGTYPTGTPGDTAIIRNGTTTTLNSAMSSQNLLIGGPQITGQATGPGTTVYVTSGGTMSLYSDDPSFEDPPENPLRFSIGAYYGGTMTMDGGYVNVNGHRGGGMYVGASPVAGGVVNLSGGTINVVRPITAGATFNMGSGVGATGVINQSGGLVKINGTPGALPANDKVGRIGVGGYGEYNLSGGQFVTRDWFNIGQEYVDDDSNRFPGTGVMSITGGTWEYGYRVGVGDGRFGDANVGHLRIMAGTLKVAADTAPLDNGHIWLGRGDPTTGAVVNSIGKMTLTQAARVHVNGLLMGMDGWNVDSTRMELKVNSTANFDTYYDSFLVMRGALEVSLTDGFRPALGTAWKIAEEGTNPMGGFFSLAFGKTTPGFHTEIRNTREIWMVCDALMHSGDANNDGSVNVGDLGILAANWQQQTVLGKSWDQGDFTGDDIVNVGDLGVLAANWGWTGAPADSDVPEPASLTLLALGGLAMLRRRR